MTYEYACTKCEKHFDVIKSVREMEAPEHCPACKSLGERQFVPSRIHLSGTQVQHAEYNPGLGCIVKDKQHRAEICKRRGLEEIGSEKPEKIHKHFDKRREEKWEESWDKATAGWVGNGDVGG